MRGCGILGASVHIFLLCSLLSTYTFAETLDFRRMEEACQQIGVPLSDELKRKFALEMELADATLRFRPYANLAEKKKFPDFDKFLKCQDPRNCHPAVARLFLVDREGEFVGDCTGTLVEEDVFRTNRHCIPEEMRRSGSDCYGRAFITFPAIGNQPAEIIRCRDIAYVSDAKEQDFALMKLTRKVARKPAQPAASDFEFKEGEKVVVYGYYRHIADTHRRTNCQINNGQIDCGEYKTTTQSSALLDKAGRLVGFGPVIDLNGSVSKPVTFSQAHTDLIARVANVAITSEDEAKRRKESSFPNWEAFVNAITHHESSQLFFSQCDRRSECTEGTVYVNFNGQTCTGALVGADLVALHPGCLPESLRGQASPKSCFDLYYIHLPERIVDDKAFPKERSTCDWVIHNPSLDSGEPAILRLRRPFKQSVRVLSTAALPTAENASIQQVEAGLDLKTYQVKHECSVAMKTLFAPQVESTRSSTITFADCPITAGMSGSLIADASGREVGIIHGQPNQGILMGILAMAYRFELLEAPENWLENGGRIRQMGAGSNLTIVPPTRDLITRKGVLPPSGPVKPLALPEHAIQAIEKEFDAAKSDFPQGWDWQLVRDDSAGIPAYAAKPRCLHDRTIKKIEFGAPIWRLKINLSFQLTGNFRVMKHPLVLNFVRDEVRSRVFLDVLRGSEIRIPFCSSTLK